MTWKTSDIQDQPVETDRPGNWWLAAIVSLFGFFCLGALIGITTQAGLGALILAACGLIVGALLCVVFATVSVAKKETHRVRAVIFAVPCAGLLAWGLSVLVRQQFRQWQSAQDFKVYSSYIAQLKADPETALREHWPATRTTAQSRAYFDAVWAPYVEFSASQVERIYAELPPFREVVFRQAACTPEFLSAHFQEALDLAKSNSTHMLENIVHHPHTPLNLVQRVVFYRKQLPFEPPYQAGLILQIRKSNVPADPREILQPYERGAEGKFFVLTMLGLSARVPDSGGIHRTPDQVASYVPGVPPDFDLVHLGADEVVFLPGLYNEYSDGEKEQLRLAEAFALEHNQRVLRQRAGKRSSP